MANYIMLECNRLQGRLNYADEEEDIYKNTWTNNISSSGLEIESGDQIVLEASAINTSGTIQNTIEILGDTSSGTTPYLDNKFDMELMYYINHSGFNGIPLPFIAMPTYVQYISTTDNPSNNAINTRNRGIGEVDLTGYSESFPLTYRNEEVMPKSWNFVAVDVTEGGAGFDENEIYTNETENIEIKAVKVESGVLVLFSLVTVPNDGTLLGVQEIDITKGLGTVTDPTTSAAIRIFFPTNLSATKNLIRPDGRRYYPSMNWTGSAMIPYIGMPPDDSSTGFNPSQLTAPQYTPRTTKTTIEVPVGLNTPSNLTEIMTQQLQRPERADFKQTVGDFASTVDYEIVTGEKLPIISTPVSQPMTCNFSTLTSPYSDKASLTGARNLFYSNIALEDPQKWEGLQFSRQFEYRLANDDTNNEINSGDYQGSNIGDFKNQEIGELGLNMCWLRQSPAANSLLQITEGDLILTNVYCTENTIRKIASGFKLAEQYYGDYTTPINGDDDTYLSSLAVAMDLGLYKDDESCGFPLVKNTGGTQPNQRYRFSTGREARTSGNLTITVDSTKNCVGTIPPRFPGDDIANDSQQLSSMVVKSRFIEASDAARSTLYNTLRNAPTDEICVDSTKTTQNMMFNGFGSAELLGYAKQYDVAIVPVYIDNRNTHYYKENIPYIAFISAVTTSTDGVQTYDKYNNTGWRIDEQNAPYGIPMGLDCSFIRNRALAMINNNFDDDVLVSGQTVETFTAFDINYTDGVIKSGYVYELSLTAPDGTTQYPQRTFPSDIPINTTTTVTISPAIQFVSSTQYPVPEIKVKTPSGDYPAPNEGQYTISNRKITSGDISNIAYQNYINVGSYGFQFAFDNVLSRFSLSDMNTPTRDGNGQPYDNVNVKEFLGQVSSAPQQQVLNVGMTESCFSYTPQTIQIPGGGTFSAPGILDLNLKQSSDSLIDSLSGVSLKSISFYDENDNVAATQNYNEPLTINFSGTLLGKLGFINYQLFPPIGTIQTTFDNTFAFKKFNSTYGQYSLDFVRPLTTGAIVSSAEFQATQSTAGNLPLYLLGGTSGQRVRPVVSQASLTAVNLPSQLDYPYLCVYSSIAQGGTSTTWLGGSDSQSKIPCVGYITRYNNQGSFFYGSGSDFTFTATRNFSLSDVTTDIRLPNGNRPRLQPNSSVIYKIVKRLSLPPMISLPPPPSTDDDKEKK